MLFLVIYLAVGFGLNYLLTAILFELRVVFKPNPLISLPVGIPYFDEETISMVKSKSIKHLIVSRVFLFFLNHIFIYFLNEKYLFSSTFTAFEFNFLFDWLHIYCIYTCQIRSFSFPFFFRDASSLSRKYHFGNANTY